MADEQPSNNTNSARATFALNGADVDVADVDPNTALSRFIRARGLTGTKEGCAEGDCGACSVLINDVDAHGKPTWRSMCSCITFVHQVAGREVVTVEGLADGASLHPVQDAMVRHAGDQCGYCTPGFCVSMAEQHAHAPDAQTACENLDGNLCRCTGYRPIRDAMSDSMTSSSGALVGIGSRRTHLTSRLRAPDLGRFPPMDARGPRFMRPSTVDELVATRAHHPDAHLVAGATELGVLSRKRFQTFPLLISTEGVAALRTVEERPDRWVVGGAATLTHLEEKIGDALPALRKMLRVFASRQIRNRATLAGNVVTASPIGDMPPVMLALDAVVVCRSPSGERRVGVDAFFTGYRKTALRADEIVVAIEIPRPPVTSRIDSYKVSKRRELDIAAVAACFRVDTDAKGVITLARVAYGGVAPTPIRVASAEAALVGRTLADAWADAKRAVEAALVPITDARATLEFRREVAGSLVEKFARSVTSDAHDRPFRFTPGSAWPEPDASRALRHESARGHVTGRALYVDDVAELHKARGILELWPVCSPVACGVLRAVDATTARGMPGVVAVLTAGDIPGHNDVGAVRKDEVLLPPIGGVVSFHKQPVAVVLADTVEQARAAAHAVVVDVGPSARPPILGVEAAIAADSFHTQPHVIARGDVDGALASAIHTLKGDVHIGGQEHFYLETHAAFAEMGEDGELLVSSSTQHPSEIQAAVSHVLHVPRNHIVVTSPRMGGGFGGKETQGNAWAALVALGAFITKRPVRVMLDRDVDMEVTGKRHPFFATFHAGYDDDGKLTALRADLVSDGGWSLDLSESINDRALFHIDNSYFLPNVRVTGRVAKTNVVSHTAFRGFGGPQGMLVIEEVLARIAGALGLPPEVVRERNFYGERGHTTHYEQPIDDNRVPRMWSMLKESSAYVQRRRDVDAHNAAHGDVKRGLAITPVKFGISFTASFLNQAGALVMIYRDGTVQVNHGGTEMGQGLHTKVLGIAMRELGVPRDRVRVMKTQTDKVPNTSATAASAGADLNGAAVRAACAELAARLRPVAAELLANKRGAPVAQEHVHFADGLAFVADAEAVDGARASETVPLADVAEAAYLRQVPLSANGFYKTPDIGYDRTKGRGKPFHYFAYGVCVAEVELDGLTGMKRVRRVDILHDVGDSLNPVVDRGQVEGGFVQGVGWLTSEELQWDQTGRLLTHSASTVQIPSMGDAPAEFNVRLLDDVIGDAAATQHDVVHGSKAVGEPPLMLALAVREALRDAVAAFAPTASAPQAIALPSPLTHEQLYRAVRRTRGH